MLLKGVSEVIAMVMMLVITLALAGTAYVFISGAFTRQTQGIEVVDSFCDATGTATITIRNIGTLSISSINWQRISPTTTSPSSTFTPPLPLAAGNTTSFTDTCGPGNTCVYRIIPNIGRAVSTVAQCT